MSWFFTAIAYKRRLLNLTTAFSFKTAVDIVAFVAGPAFGITNNKLSAGIGLFTAEGLHYKKQIPIRELFEEDRKALLVLLLKRFSVCRYEWMNADGYGKICIDGKHFYSTAPENAKRKVLVGIRAHTVDILTDGGQILTSHRRMFGEGRTDISDYSTTLAVLMKNSGVWHESGLRRETPDILRNPIKKAKYLRL